MALTVEDGSIVAGAESYASVAEANAYHAARGNDTFATLTDVETEEALRRATDYMQERYHGQWAGYRVGIAQALDWPREYVPVKDVNTATYYDNDAIPDGVKNACIELAFKAAQGELTPDQSQPVVKEKVDVIEVEYLQGSSALPRYTMIDRMLKPFMKHGSFGAFRDVVRV